MKISSRVCNEEKNANKKNRKSKHINLKYLLIGD